MPGDDLALGKRITAGADMALVRKYISDANPYYRYCAIEAALAKTDVAQAIINGMQTESEAAQ